jgi:lipid-binding SYLF domain-containing protein
VQPVDDGPKQKQKVVKKIPTEVIKNAKGLAIFTTMRTGLWVSGAGGSGILIARKDDGSWSPPSGILLHTAGLGFLVGVDIYDCVVVINTAEALEAFTKVRCTLGSEISVSAGPVGAGGVLESEVHKRQAPIFTYLKSRGFYAGVQIDGTVIIERTDENERFYGQRIPVAEILAGKVRHPPYEIRRLLETIKAAQGDTDVDEELLPTEPPPGDYEVDDGAVFGVPEKDDPDPYGVLALEKEGLSIKEAGTQKRASWEAFSFNPSPTSPVHSIYARNSVDSPRSPSRRNSWRTSAMSTEARTPSSLRTSMEFPPTLPPRTTKRMSDSGTQTDDLPDPPSPNRWSMHSAVSHSRNTSSHTQPHMQEVPEDKELDALPERKELSISTQNNGYTTPPRTPELVQGPGQQTPDGIDEETHIEEPVIQSVQSVQSVQPASPQVISRARLVDVPKRIPPKLPPRNPHRSGPIVIDASPKATDTDEAEVESKHDSAHEPAAEKLDDVDVAKAKLDDVRLDDDADDEDDDVMKSNPWAKVEETRKKQEQELTPAQEVAAMPGSFQ